MRHSFIFLLFIVVAHACAQSALPDQLYRPNPNQGKDTVMWVDFAQHNIGPYTKTDIASDFGDIQWSMVEDRASIVNDAERGNVMQVFFPKGSVGPEQGGVQFVKMLPPSTAYYYDCYIKFSEDFDYQLGGKLPGMTSGGSKYTGGIQPTDGSGWSARYMWTDKRPVVYLYYVDMPEQYGEPLYFNPVFEKGKWYRLTQYIKVNEPNKKNAEIRVWVDGELVLEKNNFRIRIGEKGLIDSFYFSTFHGGNTSDWAPDNDCHIYFDDLRIQKSPIDFK